MLKIHHIILACWASSVIPSHTHTRISRFVSWYISTQKKAHAQEQKGISYQVCYSFVAGVHCLHKWKSIHYQSARRYHVSLSRRVSAQINSVTDVGFSRIKPFILYRVALRERERNGANINFQVSDTRHLTRKHKPFASCETT